MKRYRPRKRLFSSSVFKFLLNSSIIQNISGVSLNEVKNFVFGNHRFNFVCNLLIITYKGANDKRDYQLFKCFFIPNSRINEPFSPPPDEPEIA